MIIKSIAIIAQVIFLLIVIFVLALAWMVIVPLSILILFIAEIRLFIFEKHETK